jgi:GTP-binding protein HflX
LTELRKQRATQRKKRQAKPVPVAAIVGYTNAGKSSLLKRLTGADIDCEDKLFATLDPTARRCALPNNQEILLSDTVGFIRKLPHNLVASFRATLEEAQVADFLIHIVDASHPNAKEQIGVTRTVLKELDIGGKPAILALNKIDLVPDRDRLSLLYDGQDRIARISSVTGEGIEDLLDALAEMLAEEMETLILEAPQSRYDIVALAHREGAVTFEAHDNDSIWLQVDFPRRLRGKVQEFIAPALPEGMIQP